MKHNKVLYLIYNSHLFYRIMCHYSPKLQITTSKLPQPQNTQLNLPYSDFSCHFKMIRDKLALNNQEQNLGVAGKKSSPWAVLQKAELVMSARSANQIPGFRILACSDEFKRKNKSRY